VAQVKQKYIREGLILDDGGDLGTGGTFESGHLGYLEGIILYDPSNPQSALAARESGSNWGQRYDREGYGSANCRIWQRSQ